MKLAIGVTIRQLLIHFHCASEFEVPADAGLSPGKSLLGVLIDKLGARLGLISH